jgi:hypothetical protein
MKVSAESIATLRTVIDTLDRDVSAVWVRTSADVLESLARQLKAEATESSTPQQSPRPLLP